jgi:hypothetical protein
MAYYTARAKVLLDTGKSVKKVTEEYLVEAVSVTDAEVKVTKDFQGSNIEFEVVEAKLSKVIKVIK